MNKKFRKEVKQTLRCDFIYYEGYRACLLNIMDKVMEIDKKNKKKKKKSNK